KIAWVAEDKARIARLLELSKEFDD
ncbi:MAG: hypothetical protein ACI841_002740, partial [Planctomycetota bacterium]